MFSEVMRYILDLGPTVMLPIVIIIFSKILGMKAGDCFKAGLHIGIGFVGIGLVIGGNDSNLLIVFYVQIMPDDFVMQLHRF